MRSPFRHLVRRTCRLVSPRSVLIFSRLALLTDAIAAVYQLGEYVAATSDHRVVPDPSAPAAHLMIMIEHIAGSNAEPCSRRVSAVSVALSQPSTAPPQRPVTQETNRHVRILRGRPDASGSVITTVPEELQASSAGMSCTVPPDCTSHARWCRDRRNGGPG